MTLKIATIDDLDQVVPMCEAFVKESPYHKNRYDLEKIKKTAEHLLTQPKETAIVILAQHETDTVGFLVGIITEELFSNSRIAAELVYWVAPDWRKGFSYGRDLLDAYEFWARKIGATYITLGSLSTNPRIDTLYKRRGYNKTEHSFVKEL